MTGIQLNPLGQPLITVTGSNGASFVLWATTNLLDPASWQPISTSNVGSLSSLVVPDPSTNRPSARFYKIIPQK